MTAASPDIGIVLPTPPTSGPNLDYLRELTAALQDHLEAIRIQIDDGGDDAIAALWMELGL